MTQTHQKNIIGFILKGYPRLSETFITNEVLLLEELGYQLHIFALRNPDETKVHEYVRRIRAQVTYIPDYFWQRFFAFVQTNLRLWWRCPRLYWQACRFAVRHSLRHRSSSTVKRFVQAAYLVEKELPGAEVVHFHAHFSHDPTTVAFFASWLTGLKYSFSAHAKDIYVQAPDLLQEKIQRATFIVTCTEYNRQHLLRVAGNAAPIFCVYHGINLQTFKSAPATASHQACPVILSIGRLVPKKGFATLLQALHIIRQGGWPFHCYIIGAGPMRSALKGLVVELGLRDAVDLLSEMSQTELLAYYRQADIFALACEVQNDGDRDGIPNVLVEAMAMGIPVVATAISGIPELVSHSMNGLLVAEKDPCALAAEIATLLRQPGLAQRLGMAGRAKVERDFDAQHNVEKIGDLLRQALVECEGTLCHPHLSRR